MSIAISPKYDEIKLSSGGIEDKIDVFEDQMCGWLIQPAKLMTNNQHSGYAILSIALAYFEPLGQFIEGRSGGSEKQFTLGLKAVFPAVKDEPTHIFSELYNQLRCGMFHQGIAKRKVLVGRGQSVPIIVTHDAVRKEVLSITVDPWLLLSEIEAHIARYVTFLRNPVNVSERSNFEAWFNGRGVANSK